MGEVQWVPDISHHQGDISIQGLINSGAAALIARVGQGAGRRTNGQTYGTTRDTKWSRNMAEAKRLHLPLVAYWYVGNAISADDNARLCAEWIGDRGLPVMLDHEDASGSIAFYREVVAAFGRRGFRVILSYIPSWYWSGTGQRASLAGLPPLVNSRYVTTSGPPASIYPGDGAAGWAGYGGNTVALLQFTNQALMAGQKVDCSAFRGTRGQLAALIGGPSLEEDMVAVQEDAASYIDLVHRVKDLHDQLVHWRQALGRIEAIYLDKPAVDFSAAPAVGEPNKLRARLEQLGTAVAADVDEAGLATFLAPVLAPLVQSGLTIDQVRSATESAVREVFASAGNPENA